MSLISTFLQIDTWPKLPRNRTDDKVHNLRACLRTSFKFPPKPRPFSNIAGFFLVSCIEHAWPSNTLSSRKKERKKDRGGLTSVSKGSYSFLYTFRHKWVGCRKRKGKKRRRLETNFRPPFCSCRWSCCSYCCQSFGRQLFSSSMAAGGCLNHLVYHGVLEYQFLCKKKGKMEFTRFTDGAVLVQKYMGL